MLTLFLIFHLLFSLYFVPLEVAVVQLFSLKFYLISNFFPFGSIFTGRKHFSSSAKSGRKHFSKVTNISQQARTFFIGRKHFFQVPRMGANIFQRLQTFLSKRKHFS
jgi:hypothetical protein